MALEPTSIGRLRAGVLEVPVNTGFEGRQAGNPRKQWAVGQSLLRGPIYAGFGVGVVADIVEGGSTAVDSDSTGDASFPRSR